MDTNVKHVHRHLALKPLVHHDRLCSRVKAVPDPEPKLKTFSNSALVMQIYCSSICNGPPLRAMKCPRRAFALLDAPSHTQTYEPGVSLTPEVSVTVVARDVARDVSLTTVGK